MSETPGGLSLPMGEPEDWPEEFKSLMAGEVFGVDRAVPALRPALPRPHIIEYAVLEDTVLEQFVTDLNALAREGFEVESFQPVSAYGGGVLYVALLSRWKDPDAGEETEDPHPGRYEFFEGDR